MAFNHQMTKAGTISSAQGHDRFLRSLPFTDDMSGASRECRIQCAQLIGARVAKEFGSNLARSFQAFIPSHTIAAIRQGPLKTGMSNNNRPRCRNIQKFIGAIACVQR